MKKVVSLSLDEALLAQVDSERGAVARSPFVENLLQHALTGTYTKERDEFLASGKVTRQVPTPPKAERHETVHFTPTIPPDGSPEAGGPTHRCPVHDCTYFAYSQAAVCSKHGRTVKAV